MTKSKIRVFIVDDHPLLRQGVSAVLNQEPDLEVCGVASGFVSLPVGFVKERGGSAADVE